MQELETGLLELYVCSVCGFVYDEESAERTPEDMIVQFQYITEFFPDWTCPNCGVTPDLFTPENRYTQ